MNSIVENKSAAAKFLDEHEQLTNELTNAKAMILEQQSTITSQEAIIAMHKEHNLATDNDKNRYLRYAVELSAQLQFIVAGAARALKIAQSVQASVSADSMGAKIANVDGADQAELERVIGQLGSGSPTGFPPATPATQVSPATQMMQRPIA